MQRAHSSGCAQADGAGGPHPPCCVGHPTRSPRPPSSSRRCHLPLWREGAGLGPCRHSRGASLTQPLPASASTAATSRHPHLQRPRQPGPYTCFFSTSPPGSSCCPSSPSSPSPSGPHLSVVLAGWVGCWAQRAGSNPTSTPSLSFPSCSTGSHVALSSGSRTAWVRAGIQGWACRAAEEPCPRRPWASLWALPAPLGGGQ